MIDRVYNFYNVKLMKKGKPTGARYFSLRALSTYEDIIFEEILDQICMSNFGIEYWYSMLGTDVILRRKTIGESLCTYTIVLRKHATTAVLCEYIVEIDCKSNSKEIDLFEEWRTPEEIQISKPEKKTKKKQLAKWVLEETRAVKWFLFQLAEYKELSRLKEHMSKATFFRNLKICVEKGYIKEGKLVRKVMV